MANATTSTDAGPSTDRAVVAGVMAATANVNWLTSDRIEALAAGHGMLNISVIAIANVVTQELLRGVDISVKFANVRHQPVEDVLAKAIAAATKAGADGANAALLSAVTLYLAGAQAQVGIPAGNRKLGATARMIAKVDRCGVVAIPTAKMNNKISGFAAVQAIYQAMMEGKLSPVSGRSLPPNIGGGPIYGHSALGEDVIWPQMAANGARIGTQAMLDAMDGAGIHPHPFTAALLGAAAILEIIHPDAEVAEEHGAYGKVNPAYLVGKTAAETAGLPAKLHIKVTGEEYDTARVIGDLGLILKDVGGPSVIGMMALDEIISAFQEGIAGSSGGAVNPPLGHVCAYAIVAMKALLAQQGDQAAVADAIAQERGASSFDPEVALMSINTVSRKAAEVHGGPVTDTLILATEPARVNALYQRAVRTYSELSAGKSLADVVRDLDQERQETVEANCNAIFSSMLGKDVTVRVTKLAPAARRTSRRVTNFWAFDALADVEVSVDGQTARMEGFVHDVIPAMAQGEREDVAWAAPLAAAVMSELLLAGNSIINVTVPAAVAAAMGKHTPKEAATTAAQAAYVTVGIPGARQAAEKVAELAVRIGQQPQ
ncbi:MAG TPA: hypothetical protein PKA95_06600 [Thermomicrobiales bacterium]|nr:hypothetical protein [Thermomicrobiales bacterium]